MAAEIIFQQQQSNAECGLACLSMVLSYYGHHVTLATMRQRDGVDLRGLSLEALISIAERYGAVCRPVKLDLGELKDLKLPAILHWDLNHYVILVKIAGSEMTIIDPAKGKRIYHTSEVNKRFTGVALELHSNVGKVFKSESFSFMEFLNFGDRRFLHFTQLALASSALKVLLLFFPVAGMIAYEYGINRLDKDVVFWFCGFSILVILLRSTIGYAIEIFQNRFIAGVTLELGASLKKQVLLLPMTFFDAIGPDRVSSMIDRSVRCGANSIEGAIGLISTTVFLLIVVLMMFYLSVELALIAIFFIAILICLRIINSDKANALESFASDENRQYRIDMYKTFRNIRNVKVTCGEQALFEELVNKSVVSARRDSDVRDYTSGQTSLYKVLLGFSIVLTVYIGGSLVLREELLNVQYMGILILNFVLISSLTSLSNFYAKFCQFKVVQSLFPEFNHYEPEFGTLAQPLSFNKPIEELCLVNVYFRFAGSSSNLIYDACIKVVKGEFVVISGKSGSGKTTLLKLMSGLINPTSGQLCINKRPLEDFGLRELRRGIHVVFPSTVFEQKSIAYNLSGGHEYPSYELLNTVLDCVYMRDDIQNLPMGVDSEIGVETETFSSGQYQRLLIAQALYKKPYVLLLDETLSHVETPMANDIIKNIIKFGVTVVLVTHNDSIIQQSDKCYVLGEGKIKEC